MVAVKEVKEAEEVVVPTVGKVYGSLAAILSALSVEKNGTLPSNMGGKSYVSAVDLNLEIKRLFVENKLILLPVERETHKEILSDSTNRKTITMSIEGTYTIVHIEDASYVTVGGVGDGIATGSAVAANIASTNALKNALLRTFLVTEQSVEDAAKNGVPDVAPTKAVTEQVRAETVASVKGELTTLLGTKVPAEIKQQGNAFFKSEDANGWSNDLTKLQSWRDHLTTGVVA